MDDSDSSVRELSMRMRRPITNKIWDLCFGARPDSEEATRYIKEYLESRNYTFVVPTVWSKRATSPKEMIKQFDKDANDLEYLNDYIKDRVKGSVRFASYNVNHWTGFEGPNSLRTVATIRGMDADIVALQEALLPYYPQFDPKKLTKQGYGGTGYTEKLNVDSLRLEDMDVRYKTIQPLSERPPDFYTFDTIEKNGFGYLASAPTSTLRAGVDTFFGNAIIGPRYPYMSSATSLSLTPNIQGRAASIVTYDNLHIKGIANPGVVVVSVQLDSFDRTGRYRRQQAKDLIDYIDREYRAGVPVVFMGSFNALKREDYIESEIAWLENNNRGDPLDFDTIKYVESRGFADVFDIQNRCALKSTTWTARRVDYIFIRNIPTKSIKGTHVCYSTASNHLPIILDLYDR